MKRSVLALLGLGLGVILVAWTLNLGGRLPEGPAKGTHLPPIPVEHLDGGTEVPLSTVLRSETCALLVIVSTTCPVCSRMKVSWQSKVVEWSQAGGFDITTVWLSEEPAADFSAFLSDAGRPADLHISRAGSYVEFVRSLGVVGTPTLYLLDRQGRVQFGIAGDLLPPEAEAVRACRT